jgi:hypothetical protein
MKGKPFLVALGTMALALFAFAAVSWGLEPAELEAFISVGMYDEAVQLCMENAASVAASPTLQSLCAQAKSGGKAPPPAPAAPPPSAPPPAAPPPTAGKPTPPAAPPATKPGTPAAPPATGKGGAAPSPPPQAFMTGAAIDPANLESMLAAQNYQGVANACDEKAAVINSHPDRERILKACGTARMNLFSSRKAGTTALTSAMAELETSTKARYDKKASFDLGKARILALDTAATDAERGEQEKQAVREMWDSIVMQHAQEGFAESVSDQIIVWTVGNQEDMPGFVDLVIERMLKDEGNPARQRWLAARLRMLTDRFVNLNPAKGENETRRLNLETLKSWMTELLAYTYFDNNAMVGMYRYRGNRNQEKYDQNDSTEDRFRKAIYFYDEGRKRAGSQKAKAVLDLDIAYLCSRYRSATTANLVEFYKKGFTHARRGLKTMEIVNQEAPEFGKAFFRFDTPNPDVTAKLQKAYGNNLTGYIYNLYLANDFRSVVALKPFALDAGFDWETKAEVLLIFAESANKLAAESLNNEIAYRNYKEMCLAAGSRAFKFVLRQNGGNMPKANDENFCKVFNAYWNYLDGFGQTVEAKSIENQFGNLCPAGGT